MLKRVAVLVGGILAAVVISGPAHADEDLPWGGGTAEAIGPFGSYAVCEGARVNDSTPYTYECYNLGRPWNENYWYYTRLR
ncbi:hypothetical protein [Streptosporangium sp. NPDC000396]|uniref:hypothetical protein n=1 Tax=Streptosporangium sp. NPDC000396 TaxID=3366185 RepID=UPI0036CFCF5B